MDQQILNSENVQILPILMHLIVKNGRIHSVSHNISVVLSIEFNTRVKTNNKNPVQHFHT